MSDALVRLQGPAAALPMAHINTDTIAPLVRGASGAQPAGIRPQAELAQRLFGPWRYRADGTPDPGFVLNRPPFDRASFLIAGPNFACGSSRETAATMLKAFGIRCVIAPGFGGIFRDNCLRNHMLPLVLPQATVNRLVALAAGGDDFVLDLETCTLTAPDGSQVAFTLPAFRREMLLRGDDEVGVTLARAAAIDRWQAQAWAARPWQWDCAGGTLPPG